MRVTWWMLSLAVLVLMCGVSAWQERGKYRGDYDFGAPMIALLWIIGWLVVTVALAAIKPSFTLTLGAP